MIPAEYFRKRGENVTVGVCDTGLVRTLPFFRDRDILYRTFGTVSGRHGTQVASAIFQIAPMVRMIFAGGAMDGYEQLALMLEWIARYDIDVLNLSFAYPERNGRISSILRAMHSRNVLIVCARAEKLPFPWSEDYAISAGTSGDFEAPMEWTSYSSTGFMNVIRGSSAAAALTAGLCAVCRACSPDMTREDFLATASPSDIRVPLKPRGQINLQL